MQFQKCVLVLKANQMSEPFVLVSLLSDYLVNFRVTIDLGQEKVLHEEI